MYLLSPSSNIIYQLLDARMMSQRCKIKKSGPRDEVNVLTTLGRLCIYNWNDMPETVIVIIIVSFALNS